MTTRAQANELAGRALRTVVGIASERRPEIARAIIRALVFEAKQVGTVAARDILKAVLREIFADIFGTKPTTTRQRALFRLWLKSQLSGFSVSGDLRTETIEGVGVDDAVDAGDEDITP